MDLIAQLKKVKEASRHLALMNDKQRNELLTAVAQLLRDDTDRILDANSRDLASINPKDPLFDRVLLNKNRVRQIADSIDEIADLPTPIHKITEDKTLPNGLRVRKICVPLGVVAIIYEARPNVTLDAFALCFKTGNACVLKGGTQAYQSNLTLVEIIQEILKRRSTHSNAVQLLAPNREYTNLLLRAHGLVDVCIPRGGKALIDFVRQNASIPLIETGAGVVHAYFDSEGDLEKGRAIVLNSKTRRVSVCNALDCLLVHQNRIADLYSLIGPLKDHNVEIFADPRAYDTLTACYPATLLKQVREQDFGREFLSYAMAIKVVVSVEEAIQHIREHTSGHSEAIITEKAETADYFSRHIDAAVLYVNTSTAFTDGAQFGMGAEIGISTQKLHARGPMGLEALTSYKWLVTSHGQIRKPD